jgi:hypothetical protein
MIKAGNPLGQEERIDVASSAARLSEIEAQDSLGPLIRVVVTCDNLISYLG